MATIFGISATQGPHHDAQKSTIVIFPKLSFRLTIFPSGFGAEKLELHLALSGVGCAPPIGAVAPTEGIFA